jgi:signal transduction histidine kinase
VLLDKIAADCACLQAAAYAKDEFLNIVSHELRTPLTIIRGDAEILLRPATAVDEDLRRAALTDIVAEGDRMSTILDNLLILARPELNEAASPEPCNVIRLVERVVADHGRRFSQRSLKVEYDDKSMFVVDCVESYVHQVLQNLLSNAEKYSPPGEPIIVRIQPGDGDVRICVLDSGKGFTSEEASQVFEAFFRIKDERSHRPGLGVGLSVCKRLVEVMGGAIWATSRPEGGAEVGFSLPLDPSSVN